MYLHTKSKLEVKDVKNLSITDRQTDTRTDATANIITLYLWQVTTGFISH